MYCVVDDIVMFYFLDCLMNQVKCLIEDTNSSCVLIDQLCDGNQNCENGFDEQHCQNCKSTYY